MRAQCAEHGIPFVFDPGQGLPMFSGEELMEFVKLAAYLAVNDYEGKLLEEKTGRKLEDLARELKALVLTLGAQGSVIFAGGKRHRDPLRGSRGRASTPPAAATPIAPGCSTASRTAGTGQAPGGSPR